MELKFKELGEVRDPPLEAAPQRRVALLGLTCGVWRCAAQAFEVLSDPQKKQRWDSGETLDEINGNSSGPSRSRGVDPSDIFRMYAQQQAGRGGGGPFGGFR